MTYGPILSLGPWGQGRVIASGLGRWELAVLYNSDPVSACFHVFVFQVFGISFNFDFCGPLRFGLSCWATCFIDVFCSLMLPSLFCLLGVWLFLALPNFDFSDSVFGRRYTIYIYRHK